MDPETLLTETFRDITNGWAIVTSLRQFGEVGMAPALSAIQQEASMAAEQMMQAGIFVPIDPSVKTDDNEAKEIISSALTNQAKSNVVWAIDAASLIFMHSVLDDALDSFCNISALHSPNDWEVEVERKGFELGKIKNKTYSELLQEALKKRLSDLGKESVLEKCEVLHRICKPPAHFMPINGHAFDSDHLKGIDNRRHGVVHSGNLGQQLKDVEEDLIYLRDTANYFLALINRKYGIRLNPAVMFTPKK